VLVVTQSHLGARLRLALRLAVARTRASLS